MPINIQTLLCQSGKRIDLINPKVDQICLEDISKPLSQICRYSGGTIHFYSVMQHSLNCYRLARDGYSFDELIGIYLLLHDASEAYLSDVPTPVKKMYCSYLELEEKLMSTIYQYFGLSKPDDSQQAIIDKIDYEILAYEIPNLIPALEEKKPDILLKDVNLDFKERYPSVVKKEFEDTLRYLIKKI